MTEPLAELQGVPLGADECLSCTYRQKFPANPGAGRDNRVIDQPVAAPSGKASMDHAMAVADQVIPGLGVVLPVRASRPHRGGAPL